MIALAVNTGIAPAVWEAEGERAIVTALEILYGSQRPDDGDDEAPQMSG